jgi:hypothetical protein
MLFAKSMSTLLTLSASLRIMKALQLGWFGKTQTSCAASMRLLADARQAFQCSWLICIFTIMTGGAIRFAQIPAISSGQGDRLAFRRDTLKNSPVNL